MELTSRAIQIEKGFVFTIKQKFKTKLRIKINLLSKNNTRKSTIVHTGLGGSV